MSIVDLTFACKLREDDEVSYICSLKVFVLFTEKIHENYFAGSSYCYLLDLI